MNIREFLNHLQNVKEVTGGCISKCPAHDDCRASLFISTGDNGRILLKCFAGCTVESIMESLHLTMSDLFQKSVCLSYPPMTKFVQVTRLGCTLKDYATVKKLNETFLKSLAIIERTYRGQTKEE